MHGRREISWYSLQQSAFDFARKDGVDTDVYAYGAVVAPIVFDERVYEFRIRRDKAVERLRTARSRYVHFVHDIEDTGTRMSEFLSTREALLSSVRVAIDRQIATTVNALYMVLALPTQMIVTTQSTINATTRHDDAYTYDVNSSSTASRMRQHDRTPTL